jgi:hypothetical protein
MNIKKFYQALYNRGFRNTEAHEIIGKIAVETNGFRKTKYSCTFKIGRRTVDINWVNDETGGKFSFNDIKESISNTVKLTIKED